MGYTVTQNPSTHVNADKGVSVSASPSPVHDDITTSYSTGEPSICEPSACDSSARIHLWPDSDCRDDVDALERALRDVTTAERQYESSKAILSDTLSSEQKTQLLSVLEKQADMLIYSIKWSKPYTRSFPFHFSRPMPFEEERYWSSVGSDTADLYEAITLTQADRDTQQALITSHTILRNMFYPSSIRGSMGSFLKSDMDHMDRSRIEHLRRARTLDGPSEESAQDKNGGPIEELSECKQAHKMTNVEEANYHRTCAENLGKLSGMAQRALQSLSCQAVEEI